MGHSLVKAIYVSGRKLFLVVLMLKMVYEGHCNVDPESEKYPNHELLSLEATVVIGEVTTASLVAIVVIGEVTTASLGIYTGGGYHNSRNNRTASIHNVCNVTTPATPRVLWSLSLLVVVEAEDVVLGVVARLSFLLVMVEMVVGVPEVLVIATIVNELAILRLIAIPYILSFVHRLLLPKQ
ncbi:hypothetical protein NL676_013358 [Syzygium grande]|nr:hypothetical protein NL676_013358 [Syzygium grande]